MATEFAPGIFDRNRFESLPTIQKPQVWKMLVHRHDAFNAGQHLDLRLMEPGTDNLHSWALRRMPRPGEKVLAVLQPTHSADYASFEGVIPKGYGAGAVHIDQKGKAKVVKSDPAKITFQVKGQLFTLVRTGKEEDGKKWLLLNRTKLAMGGGGGCGGGGIGPGPNDLMALAMTNKLKGTSFQRTVKEQMHARRGV